MCARSKYQGKGQLIASFCGIQLHVPAPDTCLWRIRPMATSSNGNIFRVTGPLCAGNPPVTGELPSQRPMTQSFDVFFDLGLNKRCSKQSKRRWFETPHYDVVVMLNCPPSMHRPYLICDPDTDPDRPNRGGVGMLHLMWQPNDCTW